MMSSCQTSQMIRLAVIVVAACGSSAATPPATQPRTPWERPIDAEKAVIAAKASKALACLVRPHRSPMLPSSDVAPELIGAMIEAEAAATPPTDRVVARAVNADAIESARRLLAAVRATGAHVDGGIASAVDPSVTVRSRSIVDIELLVHAGRRDEAARAYAAYTTEIPPTSLHPPATGLNALVLGALGRVADARKYIASEPATERATSAERLILGVLLSASPTTHLDDAIAELLHDSVGDPEAAVVPLALAMSAIRGHGLGSRAHPLRHFMLSYITSSSNRNMLAIVAGEVFAAGDQTEQGEVDALLPRSSDFARARIAWERAYYRGSFAEALAIARADTNDERLTDELYALWARAAVEGDDPAAMHAIDELACAPPR